MSKAQTGYRSYIFYLGVNCIAHYLVVRGRGGIGLHAYVEWAKATRDLLRRASYRRNGRRTNRKSLPVNYDGDALLLIAAALFATGVWIESNDSEPQIDRAVVIGVVFVSFGWFLLALIDCFGALP